jgi:lipopolysaccharide/colanic/teichoic acid biosynthesis glycosyltransferase
MRGEMDIVGPRPLQPDIAANLALRIPCHETRNVVPPGMTGLAQVNRTSDSNLDSVQRDLELDCIYIRTASLSLEMRILLCTFLRTIGIPNNLATKWLRLDQYVERPLRETGH